MRAAGFADCGRLPDAAANLTILGTAGADNITVADGGLVGGVQTTLVSSSPATFESIRFANKATVTITAPPAAGSMPWTSFK